MKAIHCIVQWAGCCSCPYGTWAALYSFRPFGHQLLSGMYDIFQTTWQSYWHTLLPFYSSCKNRNVHLTLLLVPAMCLPLWGTYFIENGNHMALPHCLLQCRFGYGTLMCLYHCGATTLLTMAALRRYDTADWQQYDAMTLLTIAALRRYNTSDYDSTTALWHLWLWQHYDAITPLTMTALRRYNTSDYDSTTTL